MLNYVMVMGRLTADPELKTTESGSEYAVFSIAVQRPRRKDETTSEADFFNCVAWNGKARILCDWYRKGNLIMLVGTLRNHRYTDKNGSSRNYEQIVVREIHFTGGQKKNGGASNSDHSELPPTPDELKNLAIPNEDEPTDLDDVFDYDGVPF